MYTMDKVMIFYLWELSETNLFDESLVTRNILERPVFKNGNILLRNIHGHFEYSHQSNYYTYIASNILFMRSDLIS